MSRALERFFKLGSRNINSTHNGHRAPECFSNQGSRTGNSTHQRLEIVCQIEALGIINQPKFFWGFKRIFTTKDPRNNNSTHNHKEHEHKRKCKKENPQHQGYPWNGKAWKIHCQTRKSSMSMIDHNQVPHEYTMHAKLASKSYMQLGTYKKIQL